MKKLATLAFCLTGFLTMAQDSFGEVVGTVIEKKSKEVCYGGRVYIADNGKKYNSIINEDGRFRISAVPSGSYTLNILYKGDTITTEPVSIPLDGIANAGTIEFHSDILNLGPVVISAGNNGLKLEYGFLPVKSLSSEEIAQSAVKFDLKKLVTSMTSDVQLTSDGALVFRGARKGDMIYILDGVKIRGDLNFPSVGIGKMMVYSGGLPAKYGDTLGGVIVMESKSYFDLLREKESRDLKAGL